jgi:glycine oxidase
MQSTDANFPRTADVVIIGGGVIGLAIGRALARRGVSHIVLIERGQLGSEASSAAAGIIGPQAEANCADDFFQLACQSRDMYPEFAAALHEESGTDIELDQTGTLYLAFTYSDEAEIAHRYQWQTNAGYEVERLSASEARIFEPAVSDGVCSALRFPRDMQVENRRLVAALASANEQLGVTLVSACEVREVTEQSGRVTAVETSLGSISTPIAIIAAGAWAGSISLPDISTAPVRIEPVRGQMICFETNPRLTRHVLYSPRGYLVPRADGRLLAGSTTEHEGFDKRVTFSGVYSLIQHAMEIVPGLVSLPMVDSWAGLRPRSDDGLPVLGQSADIEGLIYACGHYRNGILLTPVTGELMAGIVLGESVPAFISAFAPGRFRFATVGPVEKVCI